MPKTRTTLRIQHKTVGYMHYFMREGLSDTAHGVIDEVMENYARQYAKAYHKDLFKIREEAMMLYELTRRPKDGKKRSEIKSIIKTVVTPSEEFLKQQKEEKDEEWVAEGLQKQLELEKQYTEFLGRRWDPLITEANKMSDEFYNGFTSWNDAGRPKVRVGNEHAPTSVRNAPIAAMSDNKLRDIEAYMYYISDEPFNKDLALKELSEDNFQGYDEWVNCGRPHPYNAGVWTTDINEDKPRWYDDMKKEIEDTSTETRLRAELGDEEYERLYG